MRYFVALSLLVLLAACESRRINPSQMLAVNLTGTDNAYCIISSPGFRYALDAPGAQRVQTSADDLTVDCRDNVIRRRRTVTIPPYKENLHHRYPDVVTIDFTALSSGTLHNGFRTDDGALTEKSYSRPVDIVEVYSPRPDRKSGTSYMLQDNTFQKIHYPEDSVSLRPMPAPAPSPAFETGFLDQIIDGDLKPADAQFYSLND